MATFFPTDRKDLSCEQSLCTLPWAFDFLAFEFFPDEVRSSVILECLGGDYSKFLVFSIYRVLVDKRSR